MDEDAIVEHVDTVNAKAAYNEVLKRMRRDDGNCCKKLLDTAILPNIHTKRNGVLTC